MVSAGHRSSPKIVKTRSVCWAEAGKVGTIIAEAARRRIETRMVALSAVQQMNTSLLHCTTLTSICGVSTCGKISGFALPGRYIK
jgi:hypothetical protein